MFNQITLLGNLTREIELIYTQGGTAIAKTAIATSHKFTSNGEKKEETCFVDISFIGKIAETANSYLRKGSKVLIVGRLKFEQWDDQNGQKRSKHTVLVETMKMLDNKPDGQQEQGQPQQNYNQAPQQSYQQPQQDHREYRQPAQQRQMPQQPQGLDIDEDIPPF